MDGIPSELISSGVEGTVKPLTMSEDLGTEEVANGVDQIYSDTHMGYQRKEASGKAGTAGP